MNKISRNYGIDLLRILSMLFVVFIHVLGHGGIMNSDQSSANLSISWFLKILSFPAVNCFVLISGYIGYRAERVFPKLQNLLSLMFTVVFYSISLFFIFILLGLEPFGLKELVKNLFPTTLNRYWFFTTYAGLFLLSPLLNLLVYKSSLKHALYFFAVFSLFSIISTVYDSFSLLGGYSVIWFVFMYLIGAIIKKYGFNSLLSKSKWLILALSMFLLTWGIKILLHFSNISSLASYGDILVAYVSPTIVLMAVGLLCWASKMNCPSTLSSVISFFATSAFSVYLIHEHPFVRSHIISKIHLYMDGLSPVLFLLSILVCVAGIFLSCILIDKIRIILFRLLKIDKLSESIAVLIKKLFYAVYTRIENALKKAAE